MNQRSAGAGSELSVSFETSALTSEAVTQSRAGRANSRHFERLRKREEVEARVKFKETPNDKMLMFTISGEGVRGETWKRVCVILNSDDTAADITLPGSSWSMAIDQHGAAKANSVSGKMSVPQKSGPVLYQQ